jgi:hypothetical protein
MPTSVSRPVFIDVGLAPKVRMLGDPQPCRHARVKLEPGELGSIGVLCKECPGRWEVKPVELKRWNEVKL